MKLFISPLSSSNSIFCLHKNVFSLIPFTAKELNCNRTYHAKVESENFSKNSKRTQDNYKENKNRSETSSDEYNTKSPRGFRNFINKGRDFSISDPNNRTHNFGTLNKSLKQFRHQPDNDRDISISDLNNDADNFGTLSQDFQAMKLISEMPEEEDDIVEKDFLYNSEGKTRLTTSQYGRMIKKFIKLRKIGNAIDVLETRMLIQDRVQPENYIYNLLIEGCGQVGYTKKAFKLYNDMKKRGLKVIPQAYTSLFNACANSPWRVDGLKRATHLRNIMLEKGYAPNQTNYHAMIKAFGRCGDLETAFTLVDEMVDKRVLISDVTFNFLLQACITDKEAGFRHALLVWRKMVEKGVMPSLFTFNLMLRCSRDTSLGDHNVTKQVIQNILNSGPTHQFQKMIEDDSGKSDSLPALRMPNLLGSEPHLGSIVALQDVKLPEHRLMLMGGSTGILQQMKNNRVKPDIKTFTQLLDQIPSTLQDEEELLKQLAEFRLRIDIDFCNMLIKKRCLRFDYENAKAILKLIQLADLRPDIVTFGVLAMTCKTIMEADRLISDLEETGFRVNMEIMGTFLKNACYKRDISYVKEIMQRVQQEDLRPNSVFLEHLERFYKLVDTSIESKKKVPTAKEEGRKLQKNNEFVEFCAYYRAWKEEVEVEVLPHPWKQFEKHITKEDEDIFNKGRSKLPT